jgi:hypothetical protein
MAENELERVFMSNAIDFNKIKPPTPAEVPDPTGSFRDFIANENNAQLARGTAQASLGPTSINSAGVQATPEQREAMEAQLRATQQQPQLQYAQPLVQDPNALGTANQNMVLDQRKQEAFYAENQDAIKNLESVQQQAQLDIENVFKNYGLTPGQIQQSDITPEIQAEIDAVQANVRNLGQELNQKYQQFSQSYAPETAGTGLMAQQFSSSNLARGGIYDDDKILLPDVGINPPPQPQQPADFRDQVSGLPAYGERPADAPAVYSPEFEYLSQLNPMGDPNFNWGNAAQEIQNIIVGKKEPNMAYDLNQDGIVNVSDSITALKYDAGTLPNPFTEPGTIMEPAQYNQQQIIAGQPQGPGEVNVMDYFGAQASAPVLQPELQLATQIQRQQINEDEIQTVPSLGADPTVTAPTIGVAQVGTPQERGPTLGQTTLAGTPDRPDVTKTSAVTTAGTLPTTEAAQGEMSEEARIAAEQGQISEGGLAGELEFDKSYEERVSPEERIVTNQELANAAGKNVDAIEANIAQSDALQQAVAQKGVVRPEELPDPAKIADEDIVQAEAIVADGLSDDAIAVAERMEKFSVDEGTLAKFEAGEVDARATLQGQLADLMKSFDDGTPVWAAGAIRAANAAMASRGLGGSSLAGAAILQAAMQAAIPIAQQDAQTFAEMGIANINNKQQIALQNAAAQQGVELKNFDARQQVALQNSVNSFALQAQNLSNQQQVVIANAQIKAGMQGQNLTNEQQSNLSVAARFAELANLNLSNAQQTELQNNVNGLQTNLANLSSKQQAYITNANLAASLQGQVISNEQQVSIANAARFADANNLTFSAEQQAQLHNSELMQTIGLANLNSKQASVLQNASTLAGMDMANLDNRQQAAVLNAQAFLQMDMSNLTNEQQALMFDSQSRIQSMFNDQAAVNTANNINAQSENETTQYFTELKTQVDLTNSAQTNVMSQFNATAENQNTQFFEELGLQADKINVDALNDATEFSAEQLLDASVFNANMKNNREQFQVNNQVAIDANNIQWRRDTNTANTATVNAAINQDVQNLFGIQQSSLNNIWDHFDQMVGYSFDSEEGALNRAVNLTIASMNADIQKQIADSGADSDLITAIFSMGARFVGTDTGSKFVERFFS